MTQLTIAHMSLPANSMLFDIMVEDATHTTLYVKCRYVIYLYDVLDAKEARALLELIKESVDWDLYTQRYNPAKWAKFREDWPPYMERPNYHPNF